MKKGEKRFLLILILITVVVVAIFIFTRNGGGKQKVSDEELKGKIDTSDEYYKGKDIYKEGEDIVIEGENGGKTIISNTKTYSTDLKAAGSDTQSKYVLQDVKVTKTGNMTNVTGKLKSNDSGVHKVSILTKFYKPDGKVAGSINTIVPSISSGETKTFTGTLMGDYTSYTQRTEIEFTN